MQDKCGVLLDVLEQPGRRQAKRMMSNSKERSFDLAVFKIKVKRLKDREFVLNRAAERFLKEGVLERHVTEVEEYCEIMEVVT